MSLKPKNDNDDDPTDEYTDDDSYSTPFLVMEGEETEVHIIKNYLDSIKDSGFDIPLLANPYIHQYNLNRSTVEETVTFISSRLEKMKIAHEELLQAEINERQRVLKLELDHKESLQAEINERQRVLKIENDKAYKLELESQRKAEARTHSGSPKTSDVASTAKAVVTEALSFSDRTNREMYASLTEGNTLEERIAEIDKFDSKFSGLNEISGGGAKWSKTLKTIKKLIGALDFTNLTRKQKWTFYKVIITCIVFLEKPLDLLITGKAKSTTAKAGGGEATSMSDREAIMTGERNTYIHGELINYLPKLTEEDMKSWTDTQKREFSESRSAIRETVFYHVNMSEARRIALLGLEYLQKSSKAPAVRQWYNRYKSKPSELNEESLKILGLTNSEHCKNGRGSLFIKTQQMREFASAKDLWSTSEFKDAFSALS